MFKKFQFFSALEPTTLSVAKEFVKCKCTPVTEPQNGMDTRAYFTSSIFSKQMEPIISGRTRSAHPVSTSFQFRLIPKYAGAKNKHYNNAKGFKISLPSVLITYIATPCGIDVVSKRPCK